jgi:hypothetical protein
MSEQQDDEKETFIPTEIMGDYEYSNDSYIKPKSQWWAENGYKLKFIIPALIFILLYAALFYLEVFA